MVCLSYCAGAPKYGYDPIVYIEPMPGMRMHYDDNRHGLSPQFEYKDSRSAAPGHCIWKIELKLRTIRFAWLRFCGAGRTCVCFPLTRMQAAAELT